MEKKVQIFIIHGGMTFKNKKDYLHFLKTRKVSIEEKIRWTDKFLEKHLGKNFEIIKPRMPLQDNAKYDEWKIHFERFFPQLRNNIILTYLISIKVGLVGLMQCLQMISLENH